MRWDAAGIAAATGGVATGEAAGLVGTDTRSDLRDRWFLALVGERFDAHTMVDAAVGAVGGVFQRPVAGWDRPWVRVTNTTVALQDLGRAARGRLRVPVIGLTGSSGKTTTRGLIAEALAQLGRVHQTTGNLNNHIGVPLTLLETPEDAAAAVIELGTSSPGEIRFLAEMVRPTVRLIVNIGPAHLQELGGLVGVGVEKGALFDTAGPGDVCALNLDDARIRRPAGPVVTWGRSARADIRLVDAVVDPVQLSTVGTYDTPAGRVVVEIAVPGVHIAHNGAGALAVAHALGLDLRQAAHDMARFAPVGMRLRAVQLPGGVQALNDAYNANPASMRATLDTFAALPGRRVVVLGDMLELGADEHAFHQALVQDAAGLGFDRVLLTGPRMRRAAVGVPGVEAAEDGVDLVPDLAGWLTAGDRVLFKGSRGARVERVLDALSAALATRHARGG